MPHRLDRLPRRRFIGISAVGALAALGDLGLLAHLPPCLPPRRESTPQRVRLRPGDRAARPAARGHAARARARRGRRADPRAGSAIREVVAALLLAGVRNIQPRPVGFKFHAVLVVNSAHLASLASPDGDRWLPIFWAIDQFKSSQAADARKGDWTLGAGRRGRRAAEPPGAPGLHRRDGCAGTRPPPTPRSPASPAPPARTRSSRSSSRYGARDFREIGHKAIYVANSFRTLRGHRLAARRAGAALARLCAARSRWRRCESRDERSRRPIAPIETTSARPLEHPRRLARRHARAPTARREMLRALRDGDARRGERRGDRAAQSRRGAQSIFDAFFTASAELMMRAPGILALHATTFTNAVHYAWQRCARRSDAPAAAAAERRVPAAVPRRASAAASRSTASNRSCR